MKLQHLINRAAKNYKAGSQNIWAVCFDAMRIVGNYDKGATLQLARCIKRSVDTVENHALAGKTYTELRRGLKTPELVRKLRRCRSELSYLHFCKLGRRWARDNFRMWEALAYLTQAVDDELNDQQLDMLIEADYPSPTHKPDILPVWGIDDETVDRLRAEMPGAMIVVLPGFDWEPGDTVRVVRVRHTSTTLEKA